MYPAEETRIAATYGDQTVLVSGLQLAGSWGRVTARGEVRTQTGVLVFGRDLPVTNGNNVIVGSFILSDWSRVDRPSFDFPSTLLFDIEVASSKHGRQTVVRGRITVYADKTTGGEDPGNDPEFYVVSFDDISAVVSVPDDWVDGDSVNIPEGYIVSQDGLSASLDI